MRFHLDSNAILNDYHINSPWYLNAYASYIQVHLKNIEYCEKGQYFCHSFQKVKPIYYIDSLLIEWNISSLYFLTFLDYGLQIMKTQNLVSQKIWILHKNNKKKDILNRYVRLLKSMTGMTKGPPFAWITASMWHGMKTISPWHCSGVMKHRFFSSSALLGLVSLIFLLNRFSIVYGVQIRRVCWPIKHSNSMVIEPAFGTFDSVGRCQVLLENEISISIKLVRRRKHEVL